MRIFTSLAVLLVLATPATAQDDLYWMVSFDDADEMLMGAFGIEADVAPSDFHFGEIPARDGAVYLLFEASTGSFLDAPSDSGSGGAAVAAAIAGDVAGAAPDGASAEKHREFGVAAIWAMDVNTVTTVHWQFTGVDAYGRDGPQGYYLVRLTYESAEKLD